MAQSVLRRVLLTMMLLAIGLPLPFSVLVHLSSARVHEILASPPLHDNVGPPQRPRLSTSSWWAGEFQRDVESWFGSRVEPRGWIVRLTNQVYYSLFGKSYMYNRQIIVARKDVLYELAYLKAYCRGSDDGAGTGALAATLSEMHHELALRNRLLVVLVTPSKAEAMPEFVPIGLCNRPPRVERERDQLVASLRKAGVTTIDGAELVQAMKGADPLPPFPRGGTHWSLLAGALVSARVVDEINRVSARDMGEIIVEPPRWDSPPMGSDADLARLLNLWRPPLDYPTGRAGRRCRSGTDGRNARLIAVGGSFLDQILAPIATCGLFGRIDSYFYYDLWRFDWMARRSFPVSRAAIRWRDELLERPTVVLVEVNESLIGSEVPHLGRFLVDLRTALE